MHGRAWLGVLVGGAVLAGGCSVEEERQGELPEVEVEGGRLPKIDVDAIDPSRIEVEMEERTITVPDIEIRDRAEAEPETVRVQPRQKQR
ncbi:MAG TPA: hypothetical protein VGR37_22655 [Longimicrobiaceae bacterium]|nr:hypothetical protein [Longimicrobiaceae bacterium]